MAIHISSAEQRAGFAGGLLMSMLANLSWDNVVQTVILAAVGAVVSFGVTLLLKWTVQRWRR